MAGKKSTWGSIWEFVLDWFLSLGGGSKPDPKPNPDPDPEPEPEPGLPEDVVKEDLLSLHNQERNSRNVSPLIHNEKLDKAAQGHATWMAEQNQLSHKGKGGSSLGFRVKEAGYQMQTGGENIAMGYSTPERVVRGWMGSSGHKRNILNSRYREVGFGYAKASSGRLYWAAVFASPWGATSTAQEVSEDSLPEGLVGED